MVWTQRKSDSDPDETYEEQEIISYQSSETYLNDKFKLHTAGKCAPIIDKLEIHCYTVFMK